MNNSNNATSTNINNTTQNAGSVGTALATQAQVNEVLEMLERILIAQERLESLVLNRANGAGSVSSIQKNSLLDV